eukprot:2351201-Alexandrium_andersonii.AAC.1
MLGRKCVKWFEAGNNTGHPWQPNISMPIKGRLIWGRMCGRKVLPHIVEPRRRAGMNASRTGMKAAD